MDDRTPSQRIEALKVLIAQEEQEPSPELLAAFELAERIRERQQEADRSHSRLLFWLAAAIAAAAIVLAVWPARAHGLRAMVRTYSPAA